MYPLQPYYEKLQEFQPLKWAQAESLHVDYFHAMRIVTDFTHSFCQEISTEKC